MILFQKDFVDQGAIVDYDTKNASFIKMAMVLKDLGIKNNKFMLALYNPKLKGIDPYDPDLDSETQLMIAKEIKINPWYYLREVVRVPSQGATDGSPFILDRANLAFFWVYFNSIDIFETIPRQIGKTIAAMVLTSWVLFFAGQATNIGLFARGAALQVENVKRLKDIRDVLPHYLVKQSVNDTNNKEGITYAALNNAYKTFTAQSEVQSAIDQGRGQSLAITHWDEFAFYKMNWLSFPAATATTDTAAAQLKATGVPVCNIITTTAGRLDEKRGKYAFKIRSQCLQFTEHLFDLKDHNELEDLLIRNSENQMIYIEFGYKQLGKDEKWFNKVTRNKDPDVIQMDYLNRWISGTSEGIVPTFLLEKINDSLRQPGHVTMIDQVRFLWYVDAAEYASKEFHDRPFIIGCDTSDNVGRDYTTILLLDPANMSVVATARSNVVNLITMAKSVLKLLNDFPRSVFIPERNKNGAMFIDLILTEMEHTSFRPLHRIYNTVVQKFHDGKDPVDYHDIRGEGRRVFGFNTSETSRDMLTKQTLFNTLNLNHSKIYDQELIAEISGLKQKNGRVDHGSDNDDHDDLLIAYLLTCWLVLYGKNLHYYGLEDHDLLSKMDRQGNPIEVGEKERQVKIQRRLQELDILLSNCTSEIQRKMYENEQKDLRMLADDTIIDPSTISVSQVKQEKQSGTQIDFYDFEGNKNLWMNMF